MFPFMEPKSVLMPSYCLALAHPGMKSTSAACVCLQMLGFQFQSTNNSNIKKTISPVRIWVA